MGKTYGDDYNKEFDTYTKVSAAISLGGLLVGGIGQGITKRNLKKAELIYNDAKDKYTDSFQIFEKNLEQTKKTITSVVCIKKQIMGDYMKNFLKAYKRLAPQIRLKDSQGLGELRRFVFEQENFKEIKRSANAYLSYNQKQLGEKASNVALLMVRDGTITKLAYSMNDILYAGKIKDDELKKSSIDNLKIQSIGAIAEFSSVAVEFGLSGISNAFSSGKELFEAKEAAMQFDYQREIIDIKNTKIKAINQYADIHLKLLNRFTPLIDEYIPRSVQIIKSKDNIFHFGRIKQNKFTEDELEILAFTFSLIGAVKAIIDSPIISQDGDVFNGNKSEFDKAQNSIETFEKKCIEMK